MSFIIHVKSASGNWATGAGVGDIIPDMGFNYTDKLNTINEANINTSGTGETKRALIEIGSEVKIWSDGTLDFHGLVNTLDYLEGGGIAINAKGYEWWLGLENGAYAGSPWSSTASATIFSAVIGESNYFIAGTVDAGASVDYRAEPTDSIWNVLADLKEATAQDIGIDYPNSEIDILNHKGSSTSVKTFNAGIQIGDVRIGQSYPLANKVLVYGKSEGETRITSEYPGHGYDATSQSNYGIITKIIRDPKISTVAQANILADAEVARLKDPLKVYDFDVMNPNQTLVSGDVITLNAKSQGVSNEDVRIVGIERGDKGGREYLTLQVTNAAYSKLTKNISEIMANIDKNFRDQQTYDGYQDEFSNRSINTTIAGVIDVGTGTGAVGMNPIVSGTDFWFLTGGAGDIYLSPGTSGQVFIVGLGDVNVGYNKIVSLDNPTANQDAATKYYVDTYGGWSGTATSDLNMDGYDIDNVENLEVNDVYDYDQGEVWFGDDLEMQNAEAITADSYNLNLIGGTDPVTIGLISIGGSYDDLFVLDDFDVGGTKNCNVKAKDGHTYIFSVIESPELWFEEKISSQLEDGKKEIILDERFTASTTIDKDHPLHTIITPTSECHGLWVEKKLDRVIVHADTLDAMFDITISAKRLNYEDRRFDEYIMDADLNMEYKKSFEECFLEQKPLRVEVTALNAERVKLKGEMKRSKLKETINKKKAEIKERTIKIRELKDKINQINKKHRE